METASVSLAVVVAVIVGVLGVPMIKTTSTNIWFVLLASVTAFVLSGCGAVIPAIMPTPQPPTAVPQYIHYTPPKALNVHLTFDYPGYWVLEEITQYTDLTIISLLDPRSLGLQTPPPSDLHLPADEFGNVAIYVEPIKSGQTSDSEIESTKQYRSLDKKFILLNDYKTTVDKYDVRVVEFQIKPTSLSYPTLMFEREIVFVVNDQIYTITFRVAENDRGGKFEKGYEYFLNSLKLVP